MTLFAFVVLGISVATLGVSANLYASGMKRIEDTVNRMEAAMKVVAVDLANASVAVRAAAIQRDHATKTLDRMEGGDKVVADNLAASISRADATDGPAGASADAALRTVPKKRSPRKP